MTSLKNHTNWCSYWGKLSCLMAMLVVVSPISRLPSDTENDVWN